MRPWILDTETARISAGNEAPLLACVASRSGSWGHLFHWSNCEEHLIQLLEDPNILLVGHTVDYDMAVFCANFPYMIPLIFRAYAQNRITCTEKREKLLDIALGRYRGFIRQDGKAIKLNYDLDSISQRRLGIKLDKDTWRLRYGELRLFPLEKWPQGAKEYPMHDVGATEGIFHQQDVPENQIYLRDQYRQARAAFWIRLMRVWGIRTDAQGVWELSERTKSDYEVIAAEMRAVGLLRPDRQVKRRATGIVEIEPGSRNTKLATDMIVAAYQAQGRPVPLSDKGHPSLDEPACLESGNPVLVKYSKLTSLGNVLNKDIPALERGLVAPIHSRFESLLETGRTSSSDPNIQNLRRMPGIRECFVPRCLNCGRVHTHEDVERGHCLSCHYDVTVYATGDYSGAELSSHAQVCITLFGYSFLGQAINEDKDPHLMLAQDILNRPYDELVVIKDRGVDDSCISKKIGKQCPCSFCIVDNARQASKVGNFGFQGGMGAESLVEFAKAQYNVIMTVDQARRLKEAWLRRWPEMNDYFRWINWTIKSGKPIEQLFSGRFRGDDAYCARCNTMFQGLTADMTKDAGFNLACAMYVPGINPWLFGCRQVNFVHDDNIIETEQGRGHEAAHALKDVMITSAKPWLPNVKIGVKPVLTRRMSKNAKQVWKEGRLVPWG